MQRVNIGRSMITIQLWINFEVQLNLVWINWASKVSQVWSLVCSHFSFELYPMRNTSYPAYWNSIVLSTSCFLSSLNCHKKSNFVKTHKCKMKWLISKMLQDTSYKLAFFGGLRHSTFFFSFCFSLILFYFISFLLELTYLYTYTSSDCRVG